MSVRWLNWRSGDYVDLKVYEPDMRHLLDTYIRAEESETLSTFDDIPLVQLIVQNGVEAAINMLPDGIRNNADVSAAAIENNIRCLIVDRSEINPRYYEDMSRLLDELIRERRRGATDYRTYLSKVSGLSARVTNPATHTDYPPSINTEARRSLYDNLGDAVVERREAMAIAIDGAILNARTDNWRNHLFRERQVLYAIARVIDEDFSDDDLDVDAIFELVMNQNEY